MSLPVRGRGLKENIYFLYQQEFGVAPRAGAWVESIFGFVNQGVNLSLPVRGRGLKERRNRILARPPWVAPRAGAWVERLLHTKDNSHPSVAPRAGAWVESPIKTNIKLN